MKYDRFPETQSGGEIVGSLFCSAAADGQVLARRKKGRAEFLGGLGGQEFCNDC